MICFSRYVLPFHKAKSGFTNDICDSARRAAFGVCLIACKREPALNVRKARVRTFRQSKVPAVEGLRTEMRYLIKSAPMTGVAVCEDGGSKPHVSI